MEAAGCFNLTFKVGGAERSVTGLCVDHNVVTQIAIFNVSGSSPLTSRYVAGEVISNDVQLELLDQFHNRAIRSAQSVSANLAQFSTDGASLLVADCDTCNYQKQTKTASDGVITFTNLNIGTAFARYAFIFELKDPGPNQTVKTTSSFFSVVHNDAFQLKVGFTDLNRDRPKAIAGEIFTVAATMQDAWENPVRCCCSKNSSKSYLNGFRNSSADCFASQEMKATFHLFGLSISDRVTSNVSIPTLENTEPVAFVNGVALLQGNITLASTGNVIQACEFSELTKDCVTDRLKRDNTSSFEVVHNNESGITVIEPLGAPLLDLGNGNEVGTDSIPLQAGVTKAFLKMRIVDFWGNRVKALEMGEIESVDINTPLEFEFAEFLSSRGLTSSDKTLSK